MTLPSTTAVADDCLRGSTNKYFSLFSTITACATCSLCGQQIFTMERRWPQWWSSVSAAEIFLAVCLLLPSSWTCVQNMTPTREILSPRIGLNHGKSKRGSLANNQTDCIATKTCDLDSSPPNEKQWPGKCCSCKVTVYV